MKSGDPCGNCFKGRMGVYHSRRCKDGESAVRYLRCSNDKCDNTGSEFVSTLRRRSPNKTFVPNKVHATVDEPVNALTQEG